MMASTQLRALPESLPESSWGKGLTSNAGSWPYRDVDDCLEGVLIAPLCFDRTADGCHDGVASIGKSC